MEAAMTINSRDPEDHADYFMVTGTREEWRQVVRDLDGVGHSPATMALLLELEGWGIEK